MKAPFPYFGGKSAAAGEVWGRFGDVKNYVEPFAGSLAVLLGRPHRGQIETVNDIDCYISNFWRAVKHDPETVADWADWPVSEADLSARHLWLLQYRPLKVQADPDYFDSKIAGWWLWGVCAWIGGGWCSGKGPWGIVDGELKLPHLGNAGMGINRQLPHLGDAGMGINRQLPHLGDAGNGDRREYISSLMHELHARLRDVRICCGGWDRVVTPSVTCRLGTTGVFLDPPYATKERCKTYTHDSTDVAHDVRAWAVEHGNDPKLRIALCGYEGEHEMPNDWECVPWKARGGYSCMRKNGTNENRKRERIWFSPHCLKPFEE